MSKVSNKRHIAKALTWRLVASFETFLLGWLITGNIKFGLSISGIEIFSKTALYYFHERVWYNFSDFGVNKDDFTKDNSDGKGTAS